MVCCALQATKTVTHDAAILSKNDAFANCDGQHAVDLHESLASSCSFCRFGKRSAKRQFNSSRAIPGRSGRRKTKSASHSESVRGRCEKAVSRDQAWRRAHPPVFARPGIESHSCLPPSLRASFLESVAGHLNESSLSSHAAHLQQYKAITTVIFDSFSSIRFVAK